ncbi:MAG: hypothetical protein ACRDI0_12520 [Actinomycetota bacterium]
MAGPDRIEESRRYILGEDERSYGIWDKRGGDEPLERFPVTDEGFDAAFTRYLELSGMERRIRGQLPTTLAVVVAVGAIAWLVAGVLGVAVGAGLLILDGESEWSANLTSLLDVVGFRLAIGGVLLLTALLLIRWERRTRRAKDVADDSLLSVTKGSSGSIDRWDRALRWALLIGMGVWILSATVRESLVPHTGSSFNEPGLAFWVANGTSALSFRVWVIALVLLLLRWGRVWLTARDRAPAAEGRPPT